MGLHKNLGKEDAHIPYSWEYTNSTARIGATGLTPADKGKQARQLDDNSLWMLTYDDPATWVQVGSAVAGTFGSELQEESSLSSSTTTSEEWQQKLRLTTPSLPAGKYRVGASFWFYLTGTNSHGEFQVERDDTEQLFYRHLKTSWASSDCNDPVSGFFYVTLAAGIHTFDLDYKRNSGSATLGIGEARLELWRVS